MEQEITTLRRKARRRYRKLLKAEVKHNRKKIRKHDRKLLDLYFKINKLKEIQSRRENNGIT